MAEVQSYDVVVIGGGPGGYVAAIRAAQLGLKTACVEKDALGGICLNWGCIPTKALIQSAHVYETMGKSEAYGLKVQGVEVDWGKLIKRSRDISKRLSLGVQGLLKKYKVDHLSGTAVLDTPNRVLVDGQAIETKNIVLATGAHARELPFLTFDGERVWSSKEAMVSESCPGSLAVIGAGAIGCEFSYFYNAFGTKVTLIERAERLLPIEDKDSSLALEKSFKKQGIQVKTNTAVKTAEKGEKGVSLTISQDGKEESLTVDKVLVAVGIAPNTTGLNLKECGVELDESGRIVVDDHGRSTCPGIWAIGDVTRGPALAHKASAEGVHVATAISELKEKGKIFAVPPRMDNIPSCTYCEPQVASVGLTEEALKAQGIPYRLGKVPYVANGKALVLEDKEGFAKVLFHEETGELLGAHLFGSAATELIAESVLVRQSELTEEDILNAVHAHPTLSEIFAEAVAHAYQRSVNF